LTGCQQPVNTTHDYTNCCLYTVDSPDDEQQACSKHVEAYHQNNLIENSASCWFILYGVQVIVLFFTVAPCMLLQLFLMYFYISYIFLYFIYNAHNIYTLKNTKIHIKNN
jgi:hypothetical protein